MKIRAALLTAAMLASSCAHRQAPPAPRLGTSLIFPGGGSASSGSTVAQGTAAAGSGPWPVALTENGTNTIVKTADAANNAVRVNVVAGGASGGTSSSFGAAIPGTGTAAGQSDGTNMQLPRVFDGDTGAGTQYVSGAILRKGASGGTVEAGTATDPLRTDPTGTTTQPVSAASLPLPAGAATAAKQPALGTAGVSSADVLSVQGIASGTALPISGTVTANAGTNLNTSALALDANLVKLTLAQGSATSGQTGPLHLCAATTAAPSLSTGNSYPCSLTLAGALRVDNSANTQPVTGTVAATQSGSWSLAANQSVNVAQINGVTPLMGNGVTGTGSPRVTIASDNTAFAVNATLQTGANTIGALAANQSVNNAQVSGVAISVGNGVSGTGVQRVTIASDSTGNVGVAQASTTSGQLGPLVQGAVTTNSPAYTTAQTSPLSLDTAGNLRVAEMPVNTTTGDSGTKTTSFAGATQTNTIGIGAIITVLCGTVSGTTPTLSAQLQWSPDSGTTWINLGSATGNATATGHTLTIVVGPGLLTGLTTGSTQTVLTAAPLPRNWRLNYTIAGTTPSFAITGVYVNYIP